VGTSEAAFASFAAAAGRQAGRHGDKPFLTWYDDARGERVELSYRTFDNWVAKTANLLVDELGTEPGDRVGLLLVDHWQTVVVLAACWRAGARVVVLDRPDPSRPLPNLGQPPRLAAAFVREEFLAGASAALGGTVRVALAADLLGRGSHDLGGALPFARVVPAMGDGFDGGADPDGDALADGGEAATMAGLLGRAAGLAGRTGLGDGDRMLSGLPLLTVAGAAAGLLAPFCAGAGVVLAAGFEPERFWKRVADERVTVAVLEPGQAAALVAAGPPPAGTDRGRLRVVACPGAGPALAAAFEASAGAPLDPWAGAAW
jgi:uncharacterized protein (TIGR03089 family)